MPEAPCQSCPCCGGWILALGVLAESVMKHRAGELRVDPCTVDGCLLCKEVDWLGMEVPPYLAATVAMASDPCLGCGCCQLWGPSLEQARGHAQGHLATEIRSHPCAWGDCAICAEINWEEYDRAR